MGMYRKRQLLKSLETMDRANEAVRDGKCKSQDQAAAVLAQCQELAMEIGTDVERRGEDVCRPLISLLEDYCETCYQLSLTAMDKSSRSRLTRKIRGQLRMVRARLEADIPGDKKEMVFFPYKASMWDSLESIWMAAREDQDWEVSVVPIPYFDRNPDGSLGQMHYEGPLYPDYVPVVDWQEYDLENRRPEAAFIHNPYDKSNYVTSVHPLFYSQRLKEFCGLLCYIPYFVCSDKIDFIATGKESMCAVRGILYSDYVFVQSEHVKQAYVNAIRKAGVHYGDKGSWEHMEEKILPLGSPKFDKVIGTKPRDCPIPQEWMNVIGGREIILFNTAITPALHFGQGYLDKLSYILSVFKNRKAQALWWRPHPLLRQTFASMRSQLAEAYNRMVDRYCEEGWGIYDESPDLHRAMAWSHRYYGDRGSMIWLYGMTGKPVLISSYREGVREDLEVAGWYTSDMEKGDLEHWLDGEEKWKLTKTFREDFQYEFGDGNSGKSIFEFIQRIEL